jgi:dipeptidyl aminopeptidase/acylaminoacyl peptidase
MHTETPGKSTRAWPLLFFAAGAFTASGGFCQTARGADDLFTPEIVAQLRVATAARASPDGRFAAYVLSVPRKLFAEDSGLPWTELHVVGLEGGSGSSRPFVTGEVQVSAVDWTPDSRGISFLAKRPSDKTASVYVIPIDGGEARRVLSHETDVQAYAWSPDSKELAFLAEDKQPEEEKKRAEKGFDAEVYEEDFRPVRVWVAKVDGGEAAPRRLELAGFPSDLVWAPAGRRLSVALAPTPLVDDSYMKRKVHVVDADSGAIAPRIDNPGKLGPVVWSPDAAHLAVISAADLNDPSAGRLLVVPAGGGALTDVLPGYEGDVTAAAWRDNDTVIFVADEGVWTVLGEVRRDGSARRTLVGTEKLVASGLSLSRDGRRAVVLGESPQHPPEVFTLQAGEFAPRRLTHSNPSLGGVRLAAQEVVRHKARDGLGLEGILIRPLGEEAGKRYPLILSVHGGPEAHERNGWLTAYSRPGQVAAARGFAVFYPNYRGSTGRGVAFSKLGQADMAGKEFDDLVDAVDHLVASGLADSRKVGITGGSYGGFASAWGATYYSERFAASVMFVGISDHISKTGTTDIPNEMYLVHWRKKLYGDWEFFLKRSPVYHVEKSRTPTLILHGKNDTRVHPSQSMELFRHLKNLGQAPVRLVFYPGEGHGNRKSGGRYDYHLRMLGWFEHYLKGPGGAPPPPKVDYGPAEKAAAKPAKTVRL